MQQRKSKRAIPSGVGQVTLVEHALCPLDSRGSLTGNNVHQTSFGYSDKSRQRKQANVRVFSPLGLSAHDELFLWGCLALTLADPQSAGQLCATRHYILRQLGMIDAGSRRGGRQYDDLSAAPERLSTVRYLSDGFYDPVRAEHRRVSFGFFSYSMPTNPDTSRAWRIVWDPVFFEFAQAARGSLRFDLVIYRQLDPASRRLFLFLTKLFVRREQTYPLDVTTLAVKVLGFSASLRPSDLKAKVNRSVRRLMECGVVSADPKPFRKMGVGQYRLVLKKGPACTTRRRVMDLIESPLVEPLSAIGFDDATIQRVLQRYAHTTLREWVDITLAAHERFGRQFFRRSPAAYLMDNLKTAAKGTRTPPDWWLDVRKAEERRMADRARKRRGVVPTGDQLPTKAMDAIDDVRETVFQQFLTAGQSKATARRNASKFHAAQRRRNCDS